MKFNSWRRTMKPYLFLISLGFIFENSTAYSEDFTSFYAQPDNPQSKISTTPVEDPAVPFEAKYMRQLGGYQAAQAANGKLSCSILLNKQWTYPDAQVTPNCYDAETGCVRYLMVQKQKEVFAGKPKEAVANMVPIGFNDTILRLYGCAGALIATLTGNKSLPTAGSFVPIVPQTAPAK
jgi:hypothetical protein